MIHSPIGGILSRPV